jgi:flagellar biosynthetic protein FliO
MTHRLTVLLIVAALLSAAILTNPAACWGLTDEDFSTLHLKETPSMESQFQSDVPGLGTILTRLCLGLGVVFGLMYAAVWAARKWMPRNMQTRRTGTIDILASRSIGGRRSLLLIRARDRTLLIGVTPQAIQTLSEFEDEANEWQAEARRAELEPASRRTSAASAGTTSMERVKL